MMGESYGTTRSAALVNYLQTRDNMDFNGVILLSQVLDFQTIGFAPGNPMPYILYLPSYAAVAWYHNALPQKPPALRPFLQEVERFATGDYAQALLAGSRLDPATRSRIIDRLHQYTGLSPDYLDKADLRVDNSQFEKELMRERGLGVGRLDARFTGPSADPLAERVTYDPQSADISSAYTSAWNDYLHGELNFGRDRPYTVSGRVQPWNWSHGDRRGWPGYTNVAVDLSQAIQYNTHLRVLLNSGLFDLATPYYASQYTMEHLDLPANLRDHVQIAEYDAGHMMYVNPAALAKLKQNIAAFIQATLAPAAPGREVAAAR
jgi:carboxypeptidase C (cathepsin A)